jgi:hypothetical protein
MMSNATPCALCGTIAANRIQGRTGCACVNCLGEAAKQAISKVNRSKQPVLTASDRCLLCGDPISDSNLAAARAPYVICHGCLIHALELADDYEETGFFVQVNF